MQPIDQNTCRLDTNIELVASMHDQRSWKPFDELQCLVRVIHPDNNSVPTSCSTLCKDS